MYVLLELKLLSLVGNVYKKEKFNRVEQALPQKVCGKTSTLFALTTDKTFFSA